MNLKKLKNKKKTKQKKSFVMVVLCRSAFVADLQLLLNIMTLVLSRFTFRFTFSQNDSNLLRILCKPFADLAKMT